MNFKTLIHFLKRTLLKPIQFLLKIGNRWIGVKKIKYCWKQEGKLKKK
ncbi:hypothetical protein LEP1GSC130_2781 [Leptospira santarosai str. 200403458]|nr:hypothetical protein LEP1GSC130_2781 [Leptospira santarosai str. 200403458]